MKSQRSLVLKSCCWFPNCGVVPVAQLVWVVTCPLWTQSTDVPYITTRIVYCFSKWRRIISYSWGESVEGKSFLIPDFPISIHSNDIRNALGNNQDLFFQTLSQGSSCNLVFLATVQHCEAFIQTGIGKGSAEVLWTLPIHTLAAFYLPFTCESSLKSQQSTCNMFRVCTQCNIIQSSSSALQ